MPATANPEIVNKGYTDGLAMNQHNLCNHLREIDGDSAYCETYVIGTVLLLDGLTRMMTASRYLDQLEKRTASGASGGGVRPSRPRFRATPAGHIRRR